MATIKDFTLLIHDMNADPVDFSEAQTKQLQRYLPVLPEMSGQKLKSIELFNFIVANITGALTGDSIYGITIGKLVESFETVTQRELIPANVAKVLIGDYGLLKGSPLIKPIMVGRTEDGKLVNEGGRHRLAAVCTLLHAYGFSDDLIAEVQLPCVVLSHNIHRIIADNTGRGVTGFEKVGINVSAQGVDISDSGNVWSAFMEGKLDGSPTTQRSNAMRLVFISKTDDALPQLTAETRGKVAAALPGAFSRQFGKEYGYALKDYNFLVQMMAFAAQELPEVVNKLQQGGVTNLARSTTQMANGVMLRLALAVKSGSVVIPPKPKAPPKAKTAEAEVKPSTTTTKKRGKKAAATEEVPA